MLLRQSRVLVFTVLALARFALPASAQQQVTLISITNHWRYEQSGADRSGLFNQVAFDDSAWPLGQGMLGLEPSSPYPYPHPILTPLTVGAGRITYYFRRHFTMPSNPAGVTLTASNYVDDGAVFYLNGTEVGRVRIGTGAVDGGTLAANATPEGQVAVLTFPANLLNKGDNVMAVEVHQSSTSSSDIVFGMSLTAGLPPPGPVMIVTQPGDRTVEEGEPATFSVVVIGTPPYFFQWSHDGQPIPDATNQAHVIPAVSAANAGVYSVLASNALGAATSDNAVLTVTPQPFMFFPVTNVWSYNQSGANLGVAWREASYNDTAWPAGAGLFYNETAALPAPKNTPLSLTAGGQPIITYYFRTRFNWAGSTAGGTLTARLWCDDGAVIYLNGAEARRVGMPGGTVSFNTLSQRTVGDVTAYEAFTLPSASLVEGDNVLAVEVHQSAATSSDVVFGMALGTNFPVAMPDLIIWGPASNPRTETKVFSTGDCEVNECATVGTRRLLRFDTQTRNIGTGDLILGDPVNNPLFVLDPCHNHHHFEAYAEYRLLDLNGVQVATGNKVGFCLLDSMQIDTGSNPNSVYNCDFQGIQRGWGDVYTSGLPCQFIDITGLPVGDYLIEQEIDPDNRIEELNESNNITRVPVTIAEPCTAPPLNDNLAGAQVVPHRTATVLGNNDCATRQGSEPNHASNGGGRSIWYRWTAPASGQVIISTADTAFDTLLGVYIGTAINSLALVASNDDSVEGLTSLVTFNATANTSYAIAVDGFGGAVGNVVLNINPAGNDAFANCLVLAAASGNVSGRNVTASRELGEPTHAGNVGGRSLWYCWTAPRTALMTLDTRGSRFDTLLAVYTGGSLASLAPVADDNNSGPAQTSLLTFNAVAGVTYRIAVDGAGGASGISTLNWRPAVVVTSISRVANSVQLNVSGAAGDRYLFERSDTLASWSFWRRATNTAGTLTVTDTSADPRRFYRLRTE